MDEREFAKRYPDLKVLYSDAVRENGKPKPMDEDASYPFRLEIVTSASSVTAAALYGPTPTTIFGGKTIKALETYIAGEGLGEISTLLRFTVTDLKGKKIREFRPKMS